MYFLINQFKNKLGKRNIRTTTKVIIVHYIVKFMYYAINHPVQVLKTCNIHDLEILIGQALFGLCLRGSFLA